MERVSKTNYYLDIAEAVAKRSTCLRKCFGAIIVKDDCIVATGYNGAPRGRQNCLDMGVCIREKMQIPRGTRYEMCRSVHAEANCIISASRRDMMGACLYLVGREKSTGEYVKDASSCSMCKRMIINAGIEKVYIRDDEKNYRVVNVSDWIENDDSLDMINGY